MTDRTNAQCRSRWVAILDVSNGKKGKWSPAEDAKLAEAVKKYGNNWATIATLVPGRMNAQCRHHWVHTLDPANTGKEGKWTPAEDAKLTKAVKKYGKDWVAVATLPPGRTNAQCYHRWVGPLNLSNGKKGTWTQEEDAKLTDAVKKHGKDWVAVAELVSSRTNAQCYQRWIGPLNVSNGKKGTWTPTEDANLTEAVKKHGKDWATVAKLVPDRTNAQCRIRWAKHLDPDRASNIV
jgi:myb proto-oncogene protein